MDAQGRKGFGEYLRGLRLRSGLTQQEAAEKAKVSVPYLAQSERGERNPPSRRVLGRLADAYDVPAQELLEKADRAEGLIKEDVPLEANEENEQKINWGYDALTADPKFAFGHRFFGDELDLKTKAVLIKFYERATGRKLLSEKETEAVYEQFTGQLIFDFDGPEKDKV